MSSPRFLLPTLFLALVPLAPAAEVVLRDTAITLPTYEVGTPETVPIFYTPFDYQGAQNRIYPYPLIDKLTQKRVPKSYRALYLENEYVEVCIIPELGGRVYSARDKTNGYDFVYRNNVVKPALVGMAGAWISGGIEWNIPHHHRASTFMPVNFRTIENADGSKEVWVGETELRHGTRWSVGTILRPGSAAVETRIRIDNSTPFTHSTLAWTNMAVHANEQYQVIFPPDVGQAVYHAKNEVTDWPIARGQFFHVDYSRGVDVSWWKESVSPASFFAWKTNMEFLGGIDHGKKAGTVIIADRRFSPGKKFWNWGPNAIGKLWDQDMLTDSDGSYLELMLGSFSDNQPDYSWAAPYSSRETTIWYYPIRNLSGIQNANTRASLNVATAQAGRITIQVSAAEHLDRAVLLVTRGPEQLAGIPLSVSPREPFETEVAVGDVDLKDVKVALIDAQKQLVLDARADYARLKEPIDLYREPGQPGNYATAEELYRVGLRLDQFHNPRYDSEVYYRAALQRDPGHAPTLTQLSLNALKRSDYAAAEELLRRAVATVSNNHTKPRDAESQYLLGIALAAQGRIEEGLEALYHAAWTHEWESAALTEASKLEARLGRNVLALKRVVQAARANGTNDEARRLHALLLRRGNQPTEAAAVVDSLLRTDPLDVVALAEGWRLGLIDDARLIAVYGGDVRNILEVAAFYLEAGAANEALAVLDFAVNQGHGSKPLLRFYRAIAFARGGDAQSFLAECAAAEASSLSLSFPYGPRDVAILREVVKARPSFAAWVLLGNALCDDLPEEAYAAWSKARELKADPLVLRNLAFLDANRFGREAQARDLLAAAITSPDSNPLFVVELDRLLVALGASVAERQVLFERHPPSTDEGLIRKAQIEVAAGRGTEALAVLRSNHFNAFERVDFNLHAVYVDACILEGRARLAAGDASGAQASFQAAQEFPRNLETATDAKVHLAHYFRGLAHEALKQPDAARRAWQAAVSDCDYGDWAGEESAETLYSRILSARRLKDSTAAQNLIDRLNGTAATRSRQMRHDAEFTGSVLAKTKERRGQAEVLLWQGFADLANGKAVAARSRFDEAARLYPGHPSLHYLSLAE
ncbi:MAG: DUF5107 domain-containing protein [Opitutaceae bacterium]|nr:DUF5107 domain-containing protein [Opitutaceae bacterium]